MTATIWLPVALSAAFLGWVGVATPDAAEAQSFFLRSPTEVALSGALSGWTQAQGAAVRPQTEGTVDAIQDEMRQAVKPHKEGGVTFVSGGVGDEGKAAMHAIESGYNLRLLFAVQGSGEFLADVHVRLLDRDRNTLVDTVADGPYFFANLTPGTYEVVVMSQGRVITRSVDISGTAVISRTLYWQHAS
jgi:hypothetical protein